MVLGLKLCVSCLGPRTNLVGQAAGEGHVLLPATPFIGAPTYQYLQPGKFYWCANQPLTRQMLEHMHYFKRRCITNITHLQWIRQYWKLLKIIFQTYCHAETGEYESNVCCPAMYCSNHRQFSAGGVTLDIGQPPPFIRSDLSPDTISNQIQSPCLWKTMFLAGEIKFTAVSRWEVFDFTPSVFMFVSSRKLLIYRCEAC